MNPSWSAPAPLPVYAAEELTRLDLERLIELLVCNEDRVPRALLDECARRDKAMVECLATLIEPDAFWRPDAAIGRNDPCPCGSGKKYKKCCLVKQPL